MRRKQPGEMKTLLVLTIAAAFAGGCVSKTYGGGNKLIADSALIDQMKVGMTKLEVTSTLGEPQYSGPMKSLFGQTKGEFWLYSYWHVSMEGLALKDSGSRAVTIYFDRDGRVESAHRGASTFGAGRPTTDGPEAARDRARAELEEQRAGSAESSDAVQEP